MKPESLNRPDLNAETLTRVRAAAAHASRTIAKPTLREVPTVYRSSLKVEWFRRFSLKERLQILFGSNLVVMAGIATQHSPGKFQPLVIGRISYQKNATEHMRNICENLVEAHAPASPITQEQPETKS